MNTLSVETERMAEQAEALQLHNTAALLRRITRDVATIPDKELEAVIAALYPAEAPVLEAAPVETPIVDRPRAIYEDDTFEGLGV